MSLRRPISVARLPVLAGVPVALLEVVPPVVVDTLVDATGVTVAVDVNVAVDCVIGTLAETFWADGHVKASPAPSIPSDTVLGRSLLACKGSQNKQSLTLVKFLHLARDGEHSSRVTRTRAYTSKSRLLICRAEPAAFILRYYCALHCAHRC